MNHSLVGNRRRHEFYRGAAVRTTAWLGPNYLQKPTLANECPLPWIFVGCNDTPAGVGKHAVVEVGVDIADRGSEGRSAKVGGIQTLEEPALPLVQGAEGGEAAGELRHLSAFPGTLA